MRFKHTSTLIFGKYKFKIKNMKDKISVSHNQTLFESQEIWKLNWNVFFNLDAENRFLVVKNL